MFAAGVGALMSVAYSIPNRKTDTSVRIKHTLRTRKPNMDDTNNRESKRRQAGGDNIKVSRKLRAAAGLLFAYFCRTGLVGWVYVCVCEYRYACKH